MYEMPININQASAIRLLINQMIVPDLVVERTWFHDSINFAQGKGETGYTRPERQTIKVPPVPPLAGRRTDTAAVRGRPERSAEPWKSWWVYSQCAGFRQRNAHMKKGPGIRPLFLVPNSCRLYSPASAPSAPLVPCASEMRAFLPRRPRR